MADKIPGFDLLHELRTNDACFIDVLKVGVCQYIYKHDLCHETLCTNCEWEEDIAADTLKSYFAAAKAGGKK